MPRLLFIFTFFLSISINAYSQECSSWHAEQAITNDIHAVFNTGNFSFDSIKITQEDTHIIEFTAQVNVCFEGEYLQMIYLSTFSSEESENHNTQCNLESVNPIASIYIGPCQ